MSDKVDTKEEGVYARIRSDNGLHLVNWMEENCDLSPEEFLRGFLEFVAKYGYGNIDFNLGFEGGDGIPPLFAAIIYGHLEVAKLILDNVRDLNVNLRELGYGGTPLIAAAGLGYWELVGLLLERGANKDVCDYQDKNAMSYAEMRGQMDPEDPDESLPKSSEGERNFDKVIELLSQTNEKPAGER